MPCLIRVLARLHDPRAQQQGATDDIIATLPLVIISRDHLRQNLGEENACAICLNEMVLGEEARILQCKHLFHKQCVDEWLRVNATCPTCRMSVLSGSGGGGGGGGGTSGGSGGNVDSSGGYSGTDTRYTHIINTLITHPIISPNTHPCYTRLSHHQHIYQHILLTTTYYRILTTHPINTSSHHHPFHQYILTIHPINTSFVSASSSGGAAATGASAMVRRGSDTSSRQGQGHRLVTLMNFEVID